MDKVLSKINLNSKTGYCNSETLYLIAKDKLAKITRKKVKEWLSAQPAYTLHKPARRNDT